MCACTRTHSIHITWHTGRLIRYLLSLVLVSMSLAAPLEYVFEMSIIDCWCAGIKNVSNDISNRCVSYQNSPLVPLWPHLHKDNKQNASIQQAA